MILVLPTAFYLLGLFGSPSLHVWLWMQGCLALMPLIFVGFSDQYIRRKSVTMISTASLFVGMAAGTAVASFLVLWCHIHGYIN
jgi:hypothetical protein